MIEIILKILIAVFAVFGLYAFAHLLGELLFKNDRLKLAILVDSSLVAEQIDFYIEEAKNACFFFNNMEICAVIMEKYATDGFLQALEKRGISWEIARPKGD